MLTIILGFTFFMLMMFIKISFVNAEVNRAYCVAIGVGILLASLVVGFFLPIQGMRDDAELIFTTELVTLSNSTASEGQGGLFYVTVNARNVYSYRYEVEDEYGEGGKSYKVKSVRKNVTVVESKDCKVAILKKYERKAKRGIWTFAIGATDTEYVFVVPEGTISHEIVLN